MRRGTLLEPFKLIIREHTVPLGLCEFANAGERIRVNLTVPYGLVKDRLCTSNFPVDCCEVILAAQL